MVRIFSGRIIHCVAPYTLQVLDEGFLIVNEEGKILAIGEVTELEATKARLQITPKENIVLTRTQLLLPGFIDTHIHAPQYPNVGLGYDERLLEWLYKYTYPTERKFKDQDLCKRVFNAVVRKTLDYGTTTACYFGSLFLDSSLVLVDAVIEKGQRALVGKINMTRFAPEDYLETSEESVKATLKFIEEVKARGNSLVQAVITPRFGPSVEMELMQKLGEIAKKYDLHIQSHISENKSEIEWIKTLFNESYANVYHKANLLTNKTVLAHGIFLTDSEIELIHKTGTSISHCPESNTALVSGLCNVAKLRNSGITVGLGTDVAGGPSLSIISAMRAAIGVSTHLALTNEGETEVLNYRDVFYMATLGGAKALALDHEVGNFEVGKSFDAIIVDLDVESSSADFLLDDASSKELLQKLVFLGDDRNVIRVFVNGKVVK